jgi:hypothetical protein
VKSRGQRFSLLLAAASLAVLLGFDLLFRHELATWVRFFREFKSLGTNAQGYPEYRQRQTGIVFVGLPGGKFLMGALTSLTHNPYID